MSSGRQRQGCGVRPPRLTRSAAERTCSTATEGLDLVHQANGSSHATDSRAGRARQASHSSPLLWGRTKDRQRWRAMMAAPCCHGGRQAARPTGPPERASSTLVPTSPGRTTGLCRSGQVAAAAHTVQYRLIPSQPSAPPPRRGTLCLSALLACPPRFNPGGRLQLIPLVHSAAFLLLCLVAPWAFVVGWVLVHQERLHRTRSYLDPS